MTMHSKPLAYDAYQSLAEHFAAGIDHKPHNAFYERPAMVALWPDLSGSRVLDAGCGPGVYSELLAKRGAMVTAVDVSERMLEFAKKRVGDRIDFHCADLSQPLTIFNDGHFDFINAPLCLDYVANWFEVFLEFSRVLTTSGRVQFSCGHPSFEAEYFQTQRYFEVEQVECVWTGFGKRVIMPSYRRSLTEILMPVISAGFRIEKVVEPRPTEEFRKSDPVRYQSLMQRPAFLCIQARKL